MGASSRPELLAFSLAQLTMPLAASTWHTEAPAAAQATEAAPAIGEEVQHGMGPARPSGMLLHGKVPVGRLLWEEAPCA